MAHLRTYEVDGEMRKQEDLLSKAVLNGLLLNILKEQPVEGETKVRTTGNSRGIDIYAHNAPMGA